MNGYTFLTALREDPILLVLTILTAGLIIVTWFLSWQAGLATTVVALAYGVHDYIIYLKNKQ